MSEFGEDTVRKVAALARLQLTEQEVAKFAIQLGNVLGYVDKLNTLDTSKIEPLSNPLEISTPLRPDERRPSPGAEVMMESAPESLYESYKVPQVMSGGG